MLQCTMRRELNFTLKDWKRYSAELEVLGVPWRHCHHNALSAKILDPVNLSIGFPRVAHFLYVDMVTMYVIRLID